MRYEAIYDMFKDEREGMLILSFDCQKNLALPKVADQAAYYSRELYCYNFTVVTGSSHLHISNENVSIQTWFENERPKSSNEIASAVYGTLQTANLHGIDTVRLMADGLVGYSFLPSARVLGRIEKEAKRKETITEPKEYHNIFEHHWPLKVKGTDWGAYDWKKAARDIVKAASLFVKTNNILVRGEPYYRTDIEIERGITKKNTSFTDASPHKLPIGIPVTKDKVNDVGDLLLKHFSCEWKSLDSLQWYKRIVESNGHNVGEEVELPCDCDREEDFSFV
ncbi:hypothetical protein PR048_002524 [Dryococelus australis]|uniref:Uncharacterized protein n=1 Tax=Dryococelus australis TaxID=614101 RepID=A0ABQ9IKE6_9NEOP|nr:hypothetical protein PR048_002524 [Dryococelus australis]